MRMRRVTLMQFSRHQVPVPALAGCQAFSKEAVEKSCEQGKGARDGD